MKTAAGAGTTAKHAGTHKHHVTRKHRPSKAKTHHVVHRKHVVHAKTKHATHHKAKGLALPGDVACCTIEALAASLRGQGLSVADSDVLDLFRLAGGDDERGLPIPVALEAAAEFGLAGIRPVRFEAVDLADPWRVIDEGLPGVILGVELPGPHTVWDDGQAWWSWGRPYSVTDFPDAVINEAWAVTWA